MNNHTRQTEFAASVAREIAGTGKVDTDFAPVMGAEDFAFMLAERPGAFIFVGNGDSAGLHHPAYNFNDETIPVGTSSGCGSRRRRWRGEARYRRNCYWAASTRFSAGSFGCGAAASGWVDKIAALAPIPRQ